MPDLFGDDEPIDVSIRLSRIPMPRHYTLSIEVRNPSTNDLLASSVRVLDDASKLGPALSRALLESRRWIESGGS